MIDDSELLRGCKEYNETAQRALYKKYAPVLKAICLRYVSDSEEAKDLLQESFIKIFSNISSFSSKGSFEGWMKRVVVNTAINHYKKNRKHLFDKIDSASNFSGENRDEEFEGEAGETDFTEQELLEALNVVPEPYRIVFNMFYIEEISHKEIGEILSIEEKTSRTRLFRAKRVLQKHLMELKDTREAVGERIR